MNDEHARADHSHGARAATPRVIEIHAVAGDAQPDSPCAHVEEVFALMVYGSSMAPEFAEGDVIIIEPEGEPRDGSYVVARVDGEWALRQLRARDGGWWLCALDARWPAVALTAWSHVRGVVIQKRPGGRRRAVVNYV